MTTDLYQALAAPFDVTFTDRRGGVDLEYVTGEQVTTRLNEELGFLGWSFAVKEHGIHVEADECWALGEITVTVDGLTVTRQQFGSQKVKRSRSSGTPLDIGFDLKGAATDALKKCASLVGVGLYLMAKTPPAAASWGTQPKPMKTKAELIALVTSGLQAARNLGLDPADPEAAKLNRAELLSTITALADMVRAAKAAKAEGAA